MKNYFIWMIAILFQISSLMGAESESLLQAAITNNRPKVELLLQNGAPINKPEILKMNGPFVVCETKIIKDVTPVMGALAYNHIDLAKWMISKGADPLYKTKDGGYLATHIAAFNGHPDPVKFLCLTYYGVSLETNDSNGFDVLQAAMGGRIGYNKDCLKTLMIFNYS